MFKDIIANDIDNVFFNLSEFAEKMTIDGKELPLIVDSESQSYEKSLEDLERGVGNILIYVKKATWVDTFGKMPKQFDAIRFNKIPCTVMRVAERNGVIGITLEYGG